jgi:hypothetical protein
MWQEAQLKDNIEKARVPNIDKIGFLGTAYMHPALRTTLTGAGTVDDSDSEAAVDELLHRTPVLAYPSNSDENSSSSKGWRSRRNSESWRSHSLAEKRLLSPGSSTPDLTLGLETSTPLRSSHSGPLTSTRKLSSEVSSPNRQGSNKILRGSPRGGIDSSEV